MDCPRCNVEMESLEGEDVSLQRCPECGGIFIDAADINRVLVHNTVPVLDRLGGKANLEEVAAMCPDCGVDMTVVEGGDDRRYETCESCGGIWLELPEEPETEDLPAIESAMVAHLKAFQR